MKGEKPTFCVRDDDEADAFVEYGPEDYVDYEYSDDEHWLILTFEEDGLLVERRFFIGYPA
ncbi:hypothetical protein [Haloarchaeobius sp. DFWS5]|uniref:hypothetical protein n=1 Tax=Haloarchaeobius sp. DFWS5 TaxID=3446114 RepID=UPI003EC00596